MRFLSLLLSLLTLVQSSHGVRMISPPTTKDSEPEKLAVSDSEHEEPVCVSGESSTLAPASFSWRWTPSDRFRAEVLFDLFFLGLEDEEDEAGKRHGIKVRKDLMVKHDKTELLEQLMSQTAYLLCNKGMSYHQVTLDLEMKSNKILRNEGEDVYVRIMVFELLERGCGLMPVVRKPVADDQNMIERRVVNRTKHPLLG